MEFTHPIQQHAASVPSLWPMAERQAGQWDAIVQQMEALAPNDPNAETILRDAASLLQSLVANYGPREWHAQQSHLIYQTSQRVFGEGQLKFNRPAVTLSGNGPRAPRVHGMRLKYRHSGGL